MDEDGPGCGHPCHLDTFLVVFFLSYYHVILPHRTIVEPQDSGGVLWFQVGSQCVHPEVCRRYVCPYFRFRMIT